MSDSKITIPLIDIRDSSPIELLRQQKDKLMTLLKESQKTFGSFSKLKSYIILPLLDFMARRWLKKNNNPYRAEIEQCAKEVSGKKGLVGLNLSYEWGCTTCAINQGEGTRLYRVMDWEFPKMGENIVVAHQKGAAGEFYNITWPGLSAVFNAMAKGRFAASINLSPAHRHTGRVIWDRLRNIKNLLRREKGLPPGHLLRQVFENAAGYAEARKLLMETPIAAPVIYTLVGIKPDEGCVIERTETKAVVREMQNGRVCASNHFETSINAQGTGSWKVNTENQSGPRMEAAKTMPLSELDDQFTWFKDPIANERSRVALVADPAAGTLSVIGTDGAKVVTHILKIG